MLLVKTFLSKSNIQGLGLFADQDIPRGTRTWEYQDSFDIIFSLSEVDKLPALTKNFIKTYAYLSNKTGNYVLCSDDARFMNHKKDPNIKSVSLGANSENVDIATQDIKRGEELTINYRTIDRIDEVSIEPYLNE